MTIVATGAWRSYRTSRWPASLARQRVDAAARQARILKEQDERKRLLDERNHREAVAPSAHFNPLAEARINGRALRAPAAASQIPDELLAKRGNYYEYDAYTAKQEYEPVLEAHAALFRARPGPAGQRGRQV